MQQPAVPRGLAGLVERVRRMPPWLQDMLLAAVVSEADLVAVLSSDRQPGPFGTVPTPVAAFAVVLIATPLVFRRRHPDLTITLTGFGAGAAGALGIPIQPLAPLVALYTVAAYGTLFDTVAATSIFLAITTGLVISMGEISALYTNTLIVLGVAVVGRLIQSHREQAAELAHRNAELERTRVERTRMAVRAERSRIAREMHDILAHSTSVMVVQATGAKRLVRTRPDAAEEALGVIADTGRETLGEMRRVVGMLREEHADDGVPTTPQPTLDSLDELVAEFADAGLDVDLRWAGTVPDDLDASLALSVYRIVQEALTNSLKHAGAERVIVDVRRLSDRLEVEVLDDGAGPSRPSLTETGGGFGLVGMRERAHLVGGTLEAGPRPGGGWRVAATFPLDPDRADRGPTQPTTPESV